MKKVESIIPEYPFPPYVMLQINDTFGGYLKISLQDKKNKCELDASRHKRPFHMAKKSPALRRWLEARVKDFQSDLEEAGVY